jgi:hypothetical protein
MSNIVIKPADKWFSLCVRWAADWRCEKCNAQFEEGSQGLHCSHIFSRKNRTIRWCRENVQPLCYNCHQWFGGNPADSGAWIEELRGINKMASLRQKKNRRVKVTKIEEKEIATFYRLQLKDIKLKRLTGEVGVIEFESYQ